jgi:pimeloyl-ACP methyl ester carboxylesterase
VIVQTLMQNFTASDGLRLSYVIDDHTDPWRPVETKETLFLLHAVLGSSRRFYRWIPELSRHIRVVRLDMRGHGESGVPDETQFSFQRLIDDVLELAHHLQCPRFHLAGSSAGAIIATQIALDHPQRVKTLATFAATPGLANTNIDHGQWITSVKSKGLRGFFENTISERFPPGADPGFVQWFIDEACRTDEDFFCRFVPVMRQVNQTARLHEIRQPMLVVVPDEDPHISLEQYQVVKTHAPHSEFVIYHGYQHNITDAVPQRCAGELLRFLRQHGVVQ